MNAAGEAESSQLELLLQLLSEVNALAIRLRHPAPSGPAANDLPAAVRGVLRILQQQGPLSVPAIARCKCTSRQNVQIIINRLKSAGIVQLAPNPAHKRSELVLVTETGRALFDRAEGLHMPWLEKVAAQFSKGELQSCFGLIQKLRNGLTGESGHTPVAGERNVAHSTPDWPLGAKGSAPEAAGSGEELPFNLL